MTTELIDQLPALARAEHSDLSSCGEEKWFWMMAYCKSRGIPPAQSWAWELADAAYRESDTQQQAIDGENSGEAAA